MATKYKATSTKFLRVSGRIEPTMTKSDLLTKAQMKTWTGTQIDNADADAGLINLQILIKKVVTDE